MSKEQIRKSLLQQRKSIKFDLWKNKSEQIQQRVLSIISDTSKSYGLYVSINMEVNTDILINLLSQASKVYLPYITELNEMIFCRYKKEYPLIYGKFGIQTSSLIDQTEIPSVIITPLVGFSSNLDRIGYGGGYYDMFFDTHKEKQIIKIGLAFDFQLVENFNVNKNDIPLDYVVTETKIYER